MFQSVFSDKSSGHLILEFLFHHRYAAVLQKKPTVLEVASEKELSNYLEVFSDALKSFSPFSSLSSVLVFVIGLVVLVFSGPFLRWVSAGKRNEENALSKLFFFRIMVTLFLAIWAGIYWFQHPEESGIFLKLMKSFTVMCIALFSMQILLPIVTHHFGKAINIDGKKVPRPSYRSRLYFLIGTTFIAIFGLLALVHAWDYSSLLEAGGVIGFVGVILALTQSSWAPDIIGGIVVLHSGSVEEDDVIQIGESKPMYATVYKTKLFHTEVLNLVNNHRIMIPNSHLRKVAIHNLSKFASAKGLREKMTFQIGYDTSAGSIKEMFLSSYQKACQNPDIKIADKYDLEIRVLETGADAVTWGIFYYIKEIKNLISTRHFFHEVILEESIARKIQLATPRLVNISSETQGSDRTESPMNDLEEKPSQSL